MDYKTAKEKGLLLRGDHDPMENTCDYGYPIPCGKPGIVSLNNHPIPDKIFCCIEHFEPMHIFIENTHLGRTVEPLYWGGA